MRVLFLCTGNSARSQMAEALLSRLSAGRIDVASAGSAPAASVHPLARQTLHDRFGIDPSTLEPKPVSRFLGEHFDVVITVCDRAAESCPVFPGRPQRIHWSFEDPAAVEDPEAQRIAFERVAIELEARLRGWLSRPEIRARLADDRKEERRAR